MSPPMNRIFTISAGDRSVFSAIACGVAPWITCSTGPNGITGAAGSGRRRCFGACLGSGAAGRPGAGGRGPAARLRRLLGLGGRGDRRGRSRGGLRGHGGFGGGLGLRLRFWLAGLGRRLEHLARLRGRRRGLAARGPEARDHVLGHAGGGGLSRHPHIRQRCQQFLAGHAELFGKLVNPHASSFPSNNRSVSLLACCTPMPVRSARAMPPGTAASMHALDGCTYAPRPGRVPAGSTSGEPSGRHTTRISVARGAVAWHPAHVRSGTWLRRTTTPPQPPPAPRPPATPT